MKKRPSYVLPDVLIVVAVILCLVGFFLSLRG